MVTVKVKFHRLSPQDELGAIYYSVAQEGERKRVLTDIRLYAWQWDARHECVALHGKGSDSMLLEVQERIDGDVTYLGNLLKERERSAFRHSLDDTLRAFRESARQKTFLDYFRSQIIQLQVKEKFGTARNYHRTLNSFRHFLGGEDLLLSECTDALISSYDDWLSTRHVVRNTKSFYMRILRSVYNKAVKQGLTKQKFPFEEVYTGVDQTRKRAMDESYLLRLSRLALPSCSLLGLSRDVFLFSYYTRGMSFVDIAYLKKEDLRNGMIHYVRRKTGQSLFVRIEPCMWEIIRRYEESCRNTPYVFPFVKSQEPFRAFRQYQGALTRYNRSLKQLGEMIGLDRPLSSYMARHTWATAARDHHIPLAVISAGMGHTSEKTTRIYLASLENSVIDQANKLLLEAFDA